MITFSMIPWNTPEKDTKGHFKFDVVFTSNRPGFVVQYLRKKLTYKETAKSPWNKSNRAYWEIFYIGDDGMSWKGDRFAQTSIGKEESEGCLIQIGYAYFFPYHLSEYEVEIYKTEVNLSPFLNESLAKKSNAVRLRWPTVCLRLSTNLKWLTRNRLLKRLTRDEWPLKKAIIRKLTVNWGEHAPLSQLNYSNDGTKTSEGWDSVVVEEVFAGEKIFKQFPWDWDSNKKRPLLKDQNERKKYLSKYKWKDALLTLNRNLSDWEKQTKRQLRGKRKKCIAECENVKGRGTEGRCTCVTNPYRWDYCTCPERKLNVD